MISVSFYFDGGTDTAAEMDLPAVPAVGDTVVIDNEEATVCSITWFVTDNRHASVAVYLR